MTKQEFDGYRKKYARQLDLIRQAAHDLHQSVNETYGDDLPYGFHLDMVFCIFVTLFLFKSLAVI